MIKQILDLRPTDKSSGKKHLSRDIEGALKFPFISNTIWVNQIYFPKQWSTRLKNNQKSNTKHSYGGLKRVSAGLFHWITEWLGLEETFKTIRFQSFCHGQAHLPLAHASPSLVQPIPGMGQPLGAVENVILGFCSYSRTCERWKCLLDRWMK